MGIKIDIEQSLEKYCECSEKKGKLVFYCFEYTNYYCPQICHYAKQKLENEKRRFDTIRERNI